MIFVFRNGSIVWYGSLKLAARVLAGGPASETRWGSQMAQGGPAGDKLRYGFEPRFEPRFLEPLGGAWVNAILFWRVGASYPWGVPGRPVPVSRPRTNPARAGSISVLIAPGGAKHGSELWQSIGTGPGTERDTPGTGHAGRPGPPGTSVPTPNQPGSEAQTRAVPGAGSDVSAQAGYSRRTTGN
jgi:hypothetical protein